MPSVAPSTSGSFGGRRPSRVSPSPSLSSTTSYSFDSATTASSATPFDPIDHDKTPTKRPISSRRTRTLPTPPSSSPLFNADEIEVDSTAQRFGLVRMQSDTTEGDTDGCYDTETDEDVPLKKKNPYKILKSFLRLSGDQEVVGREEEKNALMEYLNKGNEEDVGVYISGPPGTGKTATVTSIGRGLRKQGWEVVELGCMGMKVGDVWKRLGEAMNCGKTEEAVRAHLSRPGIKT
jgi:cell division control protein 6